MKTKDNFLVQLTHYAFFFLRRAFWFSRLALKMTGRLENQRQFFQCIYNTSILVFKISLLMITKRLDNLVTIDPPGDDAPEW